MRTREGDSIETLLAAGGILPDAESILNRFRDVFRFGGRREQSAFIEYVNDDWIDASITIRE